MQVGDYARYGNTGTVGKVQGIRQEGDVTWVLLDVYGLYYDSRCLEKASKDQYHEITYKEKDLQERLDDISKLEEMLEDIEVEDITPSGAA